MSHSGLFNKCWQHLNFRRNTANDLPLPTSPHLRTVATAGAALLVGASAALGSYFGFIVGSHQHVLLGIVFAGAALGGELLKPFAVSEAIDSFGRWHIVRGLACVALALVCIVYSFTAELGLAAGSRSDLAAARAAQAEAARTVTAERQRAEAELATLPVARPAGQVQAELDGLLIRPGVNGCVVIDGKVTREVCPRVAELRSEKAVAERRDQLATVISRTASGPPQAVQQADPLAGAVATYAQAAGWSSWTAEAVLPWLALIPVLFLELGSALAVVVVRGIGGPTPQIPAVAAPEAVQTPSDEVVQPRPARPRKVTSGPVLGDMAARLKRAGGTIEGSQRQLAKTLGTSKTTVHRALHMLVTSGAAVMTATPAGTRLVLA